MKGSRQGGRIPPVAVESDSSHRPDGEQVAFSIPLDAQGE